MQRKRGKQLEKAIFEAAIILFDEEGIDAVSFYNVAERAQTSRGVLYRRWKNPNALLFDAMHYLAHQDSGVAINMDPTQFPDYGNLRADLLAYAKRSKRLHHALSKHLMKFLMLQTIINKDHSGDVFLSSAQTSTLMLGQVIANRAIQRGEIKQAPSKDVMLLAANLRLYYTVVASDHEPETETLVDQIILPAWLANN